MTHHGGRPLTVLGVLGEILITVSFVLFLYVGWELWWTNLRSDAAHASTVRVLAAEFGSSSEKTGPPADGDVPVTPSAPEGEAFGILYAPRLGQDYAQPVAEGVGLDVLNSTGVGRYPGTQWPGQPGNVALAGHRQSHGAVFRDLDRLQPGDRLYLATETGYYTYRHTATEIVEPSDVSVLLPVPGRPEAQPVGSVLTLTTCHPPYTVRERLVATAELESWQPHSAGAPAEIADVATTNPRR